MKAMDLGRAQMVRRFCCGVSAAALAVSAAPALAQDEAADDQAGQAAAAPASERPIIVTGSRIITNGMQAPVPLTGSAPTRLKRCRPVR